MVRLIKFLHGHPRAHPVQEFNRVDMAKAIGTTLGTIAQLMGPHYKFASERDDLLKQAGWRAVPLAGGKQEWFIRQ